MQGFEDDARRWTPGAEPATARADGVEPASETYRGITEQADFDDFVRTLIARGARPKGEDPSPRVEVLTAKLLGILMEMPRKAVEANRVYFEAAFDELGSEKPNLALVQSIFLELVAVRDRTSWGVTRWISFVSGSTPLSAAMSALLVTILVSILIILLLATGHRNLVRDFAGTSALFSTLTDGTVELLIIAIHAAFVDSIVSMVARIQDFLVGSAATPPIIFVSILRKPFMAASFVVLVFAVLKAGLISFPGVSLTGPSAPYIAWALGFLCGFSERFAQDFVTSASGRLGNLEIGVDPPSNSPGS